MSRYAAVVLLGFGGPERPEEIRPFLDRVLEGKRIPPARYEAVVSHYEQMPGGKSPFNELTGRQAEGLARELRARRIGLPVRVAYKNAAPFVDDVARELAGRGTLLGIILALFQSPASWQKYQTLPDAQYVEPYFDHPLLIQANAARVRSALERLGRTSFDDTALIFTAHSIPQAMADASPYAAQFARTAELVAQAAGAREWQLAYQSRSGSPADPWLEPDVRDLLIALPSRGIQNAVVTPIGFLCDHVEVLYDLDVEAAAIARESGVRMERAEAINDHPLFIRMLADLVQQCFA